MFCLLLKHPDVILGEAKDPLGMAMCLIQEILRFAQDNGVFFYLLVKY